MSGFINLITKNIIVYGQIYNASDGYLSPTGATQTIDWNDGNVQTLNLGATASDVTVTMINAKATGSYVLRIMQGGNANNVIWANTTKWVGGTPTITTDHDTIDIVTLLYDGVIFYNDIKQNYI